jgi:hypothetical protein
VIRVEHVEIAEIVIGRVRKFVIGLPQSASLDDRPVRNTAEREHHGSRRDGVQFICEKAITGVDLRTNGLVVRRQALDRVGDAAVQQRQAIVRGQRFRSRAEAELVQGLVEQDSGPCMPGASPTISSRAATSPNGGTGRQ